MSMYNANCVHSQDCGGEDRKFREMLITETELVKPIIKEHFLKEYILGMGDTYEMLRLYCKTFDVDEMLDTRMIIIKPTGAHDFEDFFFIKNTAEQYIGGENILLSTTINDFLFIITTILDKTEIMDLLEKIRKTAKQCYNYSIMAVYGKVSYLSEAPAAYERLKTCMGYSFYSGSDKTLYENDLKVNENSAALRPDYGTIEQAVRRGNIDKMRRHLNRFFDDLERAMPTPAVAKTHCLELYVCIIRCCETDKIDNYMKGIMYLQDAKTIGEIRSFIEEKGLEITEANTPEKRKVYSALIRDTMRIIDENVRNENLSLRWLAGTILYTNVDYLGKLFKKETGKNFSHYVMEKRMELAKETIIEGKYDRIYEIAEKVGYGSNSQYFSQVFKKYTGVSPLEYKEFAKLMRENEKTEN